MTADGRQPQDPYVGGALWSHVLPTQALQPTNWDQLYIPAGLTLNASIPILNNDYLGTSELI